MPPRKLPAASRLPSHQDDRSHQADRKAVKAILDEAREEELLRLAQTPDPLPTKAAVARLGAVKVQELDGSWIHVSSLWQERPAAVVWLRHYG